MTNVCILVQCGLPAVGKTTFVKEFSLRVGQNLEADDTVLVRRPRCDMLQRLEARPQDTTGPPASHPVSIVCDSASGYSRCKLIPLHVCYDKLMPREIEIELLQHSAGKGDESTSKSKSWKEYRKRILECVECFLGYLCTRNENCLAKLITESETDSLVHLFKENVLISQQFEQHGIKDGNYVVVIDDNMYYQSMRYDYFQLARKCNFPLTFHSTFV